MAKKIAFYSFKGGTGRTLAMVNVAYFLSCIGCRVCIVDMDLEAPGAHYKFYSEDNIKLLKGKKGVVDYVDYYQKQYKNNMVFDDIPEPDLKEYIRIIDGGNEQIHLFPSSIWDNDDVPRKTGNINWKYLFDTDGGEFLYKIFERLEDEYNDYCYDYILIDCRAGITPYGGLIKRDIADEIVVFSMSSLDNLDGTAGMVRTIQELQKTLNEEYGIPIPTAKWTWVLTKFSESQSQDEERFLNEKWEKMQSSVNGQFSDYCAIHFNDDMAREEYIALKDLGFSEKNNLSDDKNKIVKDYYRLCKILFSDEEIESKLIAFLDMKSNPLDLQDDIKEQEDAKKISLIELVTTLAEEFKYTKIWEKLSRIYSILNYHLVDTRYLPKFFHAIIRYYTGGGNDCDIDKILIKAFLHYGESNNFNPLDLINTEESNKVMLLGKIQAYAISDCCDNGGRFRLAKVLSKNHYSLQIKKSAMEIYAVLYQKEDNEYREKVQSESVTLFINVLELLKTKAYRDIVPQLSVAETWDITDESKLKYRNRIFDLYAKDALSDSQQLSFYPLKSEGFMNYLSSKTPPVEAMEIGLNEYKNAKKSNEDYTDAYYKAVEYGRNLMNYYQKENNKAALDELVDKYETEGLRLKHK